MATRSFKNSIFSSFFFSHSLLSFFSHSLLRSSRLQIIYLHKKVLNLSFQSHSIIKKEMRHRGKYFLSSPFSLCVAVSLIVFPIMTISELTVSHNHHYMRKREREDGGKGEEKKQEWRRRRREWCSAVNDPSLLRVSWTSMTFQERPDKETCDSEMNQSSTEKEETKGKKGTKRENQSDLWRKKVEQNFLDMTSSISKWAKFVWN